MQVTEKELELVTTALVVSCQVPDTVMERFLQEVSLEKEVGS